MSLRSWLRILSIPIVLACALSRPTAAASPQADPLLPNLQDDDPQARARVLALLRDRGTPPCAALGGYARYPASRVRENAVKAMDEAGCSDFDAYRGFLLDPAAGVVDAIIELAQRRQLADAVPFLVGCLSDRRRIVTEEGDWSLGEHANQALMAITCQSFHFEATASEDDRRNVVTRWREWYLAKRRLPRGEWIEEGIGRGRDYAQRDYGPVRLEGIRLLSLIGPPALPALREALARKPGDLQAEVVCLPDEPPVVTDSVPCALVVRNASGHRLTFAPPAGGPEVRLTLVPAGKGDARPSRPDATPSRDVPRSPPDALVKRLVDLAPGEQRRFEFNAGPVPGAGRYRVHAAIDDLAIVIAGEDGRTPARGSPPQREAGPVWTIEAETILRFEQ